MIYFAMATDGGPVKIGQSIDVESRLRSLEYRYGRTLILLATFPGGPDEEAEIHARFDHLRLNNPGRPLGQGRRPEQFRPTPELMEFIGCPAPVKVDPDAVEVMRQGGFPCPVRLDLATETHRLLRLLAADENVSVAEYARDFFKQHIQEEAKRRELS